LIPPKDGGSAILGLTGIAEGRGRRTEKEGISNIEPRLKHRDRQGILNDEGRRSEIGRTGNQGVGDQDSRVSGKRKEGGRWMGE